MALFSSCSSPISSLHSFKQPVISSPSSSETLISASIVPKISTTSISISYNSGYSSPQRLRCCASSSSSTNHDESPSSIIFIKGLPQSTSEGSLKRAFSQFGEVSRVKIIMDKKSRQPLGFAYVWFTCEESAQLAVKEMDGKVCFCYNCEARILQKSGKDNAIQVLKGTTFIFGILNRLKAEEKKWQSLWQVLSIIGKHHHQHTIDGTVNVLEFQVSFGLSSPAY